MLSPITGDDDESAASARTRKRFGVTTITSTAHYYYLIYGSILTYRCTSLYLHYAYCVHTHGYIAVQFFWPFVSTDAGR